MTNEERIKLLDAGYTKEEIESGEQNAEQNAEQSAEQNAEQNAENQTHEGALNGAADIKALSDAVAELTKTVKAMQDSNVKNADSGKPDVKSVVNETIKNFISDM